MRKKEYSSISHRRSGDNTKSISWNKGKRTVKKSFTKVDKNGELYTVESQHSFNFLGLFKIAFLVLILCALFRSFMGVSEKTFYSFLTMLQDVPDIIPMTKIMEYFQFSRVNNYPDWIKWLFDFGSGFVTLMLFIVKGLLSVLSYIFYFLKWLFI